MVLCLLFELFVKQILINGKDFLIAEQIIYACGSLCIAISHSVCLLKLKLSSGEFTYPKMKKEIP